LTAFNRPWDTTSEYSQAPLYYGILAAALAPIRLPDDAGPHLNPFVAWPGHPWREAVALHRSAEGWPYRGGSVFVHLGRLVSTIFGLITLLATFGLVITVTGRFAAALFATAWLGFAPVFVLTSARLDNDAAAMATSALCLLACARLLVASGRPSRTA